MRMFRGCVMCGVGLALWLALGSVPARAETVIFTIDHDLSQISWPGVSDQRGPWLDVFPGSLTTGVTGHFLVDFDPFVHVPTSIRFLPGHGYYAYDAAHQAPAAFGPDPVNLLAVMGAGGPQFAMRDYQWDFFSGDISGSGGVFPANETSFTITQGEAGLQIFFPATNVTWLPVAGAIKQLTGGTWTLSEQGAGSGDWTLGLSGQHFVDPYSIPNSPIGTGSIIFAGDIVAKAHFGASNIDELTSGETQAAALGGSATPGGVSANFSAAPNPGVFSAQQLPNETALAADALAALSGNVALAQSNQTLGAATQLWNVDYTGDLNGGTVDLVFAYDESLLPEGIDESKLGIWHFNSNTNAWEFGGTVNEAANTISFTTDNFSPFVSGVPEPSTFVMLALGIVGLAVFARRRAALRR